MSKHALVVFSFCFLFMSCEEDPASSGTMIFGFVSPTMSSTNYDSIAVSLTATSALSLVRVELFLDHSLVQYFTKAPYNYTMSTLYFLDGSQHVLEATAYDKDGNVYEARPVIIYLYRFRPSYVYASFYSDSMVNVSWYDNSTFETGFEIEEQLNSGPYVKAASVDSNTTFVRLKQTSQFTDTVRYRVRALRGTEQSGYSNIAVANRTLPAPTEVTAAAVNDTVMKVSWKDNTSAETGYRVYISSQSGSFFLNEVFPANTLSAEFPIRMLNFSMYQVSVAALRNNFNSQQSSTWMTFTVPVPYGLSISTNAQSTLVLQWKDTCLYRKGFMIERAEGNGSFALLARTGINVLSYTDVSVDTTKVYSYRVSTETRYTRSLTSSVISVGYTPGLSPLAVASLPNGAGSFTLNHDGTKAVTTDYNSRSVSIWDLATMSHEFTFTYVDSTAQGPNIAALHPNGKKVAVGFDYNYFMTFNASTGARISYVDPASNVQMGISSLAYNKDGTKLATSGWGINIWQDGSNGKLGTIKNSGYTYDIKYSPTEEKLITNLRTGTLHIYETVTYTFLTSLANSFDMYTYEFSTDGSQIVGTNNNTVTIWKTATGEQQKSFQNLNGIISVALSSSDKMLFTSHYYEGIKIWDLTTDKVIWSFKGSLTENERLRLSPDNRYLYSAGGTTMRKWEVKRVWNTVTI